jgi:hypothetical protein
MTHQELFERIKMQGEPNLSHTLDLDAEFLACLKLLGERLNKLAEFEKEPIEEKKEKG